jgi:uncharacterized protein
MIASRFTVSVPGFPDAGKHLLYNTRSQAQVVIDDQLMKVITDLPVEPGTPGTASTLAQLAKLGFIVGTEQEDSAALDRMFARVRNDNRILRPTVLTTYSCNFACTYCVEEGIRGPVFMEDGMAHRAADYIIAKCSEYGSEKISLTFYGGEPLLNMPAIRTVARRLADFSGANAIPMEISLSTNGVLLTPDIIRELKPFGLKGAKITLDGPQETHDKNRPFRNGKGSFDILVANVAAAADLIDIMVEVNFDDANVMRIPELLDYLVKIEVVKKISSIIFNPISSTPKDREGLRPSTESDRPFLSRETARHMIELQTAALGRGFPVRVGVVAHMCEMIAKKTSFIIDPHGDLYRCGGLAGRKEFGFGTLGEPEHDPYLGLELWKRCAHCALAPLCGDGCPFGAYVQFGDPLMFNCGKESMEYLVRENLKLAYLQKSRKP